MVSFAMPGAPSPPSIHKAPFTRFQTASMRWDRLPGFTSILEEALMASFEASSGVPSDPALFLRKPLRSSIHRQQGRVAYIADNLSAWVEKAIKIRESI